MFLNKSNYPFVKQSKPLLLCLAVNAALSGHAFSEEQDSKADDKPGINTVIITAQRRSESLQDVPLSVTAIYGDKLREDNMASIEDVSAQTPGLVFSAFSVGQPEIAIRGIGTKEDGAAASDSTVISIDDVYISARTAQVFDIFDLERVEVLRGPQGTLYGKNSIGGSINFVTSKPSQETQMRLRATVGENGRQDLGGMVSGAFNDNWLGKFSFSNRTYDGHITNVHNGKELDSKDTLSWRGQLIWNPSENTELLLTVDGADDDIGDTFRKPVGSAGDSTENDANNPIAVGEAFGIGGVDSSPYLAANDEVGFTKREVEGYAFRVNMDFDNFTFTSITSYRESDFDWAEDSEGLPKPSGGDPTLPADNGFRRDITDSAIETTDQLTQEIRFISSEDQSVEWVVGAFYSLESIDRTETFCIPNCGGTILDVQYPDGTAQWPSNLIVNSSIQANESTSWATYGQASYDISKDVSITGGLRYSFEEKDVRFQGQVDQGIAPVGVFIQENFDVSAKDDWSNVSGRIVVDWKLNEEVMAYSSVSNGFKSGGFIGSPSTPSRASNSFDEETATNYEFGLKSTLLDGDLRLNTSVFFTDYDDLQVTRFAQLADNPTNAFGEFVTENAASAEIFGFETEFTWLATEFLEIGGSYAYLDATFKQFNPQIANLAPGGGTLACPENSTAVSNDPVDGCIPDFSGNRLRQAPENMFNLYARHVYDMGDSGSITSKLSYRYQDDSFYDPDNNAITVIPSYSIVDALVSWKSVDEYWSVTAWIKNLTDEEYRTHVYSQRNAQIAFATFGQPKRFGITVEYSY